MNWNFLTINVFTIISVKKTKWVDNELKMQPQKATWKSETNPKMKENRICEAVCSTEEPANERKSERTSHFALMPTKTAFRNWRQMTIFSTIQICCCCFNPSACLSHRFESPLARSLDRWLSFCKTGQKRTTAAGTNQQFSPFQRFEKIPEMLRTLAQNSRLFGLKMQMKWNRFDGFRWETPSFLGPNPDDLSHGHLRPFFPTDEIFFFFQSERLNRRGKACAFCSFCFLSHGPKRFSFARVDLRRNIAKLV